MDMDTNNPVERQARTTMWIRATSNIPITLHIVIVDERESLFEIAM